MALLFHNMRLSIAVVAKYFLESGAQASLALKHDQQQHFQRGSNKKTKE